jgi:hypothetical protein
LYGECFDGCSRRSKRKHSKADVRQTGVGFFSVSYNYKSCTIFTYEQVVKDREYLVETNREQLKKTSASLATGILL